MIENNKIKIGITFGALADPIAKQLKKQGFTFDEKKVKTFELERDAITRLRFGSHLLTDSLADKLFGKLHKAILAHVAKENNLTVLKKGK